MKKTQKRTLPLVGQIFKKVAPKIGAKVIIEDKWHIVGQVVYPSGKKRYFRNYSIDINTMGASEIARDKDYASYFMTKMGYPVVPGRAFYAPAWALTIGSDQSTDAACAYASTLGFPVIVKPNSSSQGRGVTLCHTRRELKRALTAIFDIDNIALVQVPVVGKDYRIVVLGDRVISAYERIPLNVVGDGKSTINQLLEKKQRGFRTTGRDTKLTIDDVRIKNKLTNQGFNLSSIPTRHERVYLLDNANLSTGGDAIDVTATIHPSFSELAIRLTADMGLTLCGVDLMINGDIAVPTNDFHILEINSAPGLDHYIATGPKQRKIVEAMYLEVLKEMER